MSTFIAGAQFFAGIAWGVLGLVGLVFVVASVIKNCENQDSGESK